MNENAPKKRGLLDWGEAPGCTSTDMSTASRVGRLGTRLLRRIYQKAFFLEQWYLLFDLYPHLSVTSSLGAARFGELKFGEFRTIRPPDDRFWADPCVVESGGHYYIFVEEYPYKTRKGQIAVIELDGHGNLLRTMPVLQKDYHLSYPCVFEWEGKHYMVPESAENKTVELYECVEFPARWEFKTNLLADVYAVDTTLFRWQDKWWLFTGMGEDQASLPLVPLFLFYADDLFSGDWRPHPQNPVGSDVLTTRPAGKVFEKDGRIFRPSQECSAMYGHGFHINEILQLSETEYCEQRVLSVKPDWSKEVLATHTFGQTGPFTIIDAFTRKPRFGSSAQATAAAPHPVARQTVI